MTGLHYEPGNPSRIRRGFWLKLLCAFCGCLVLVAQDPKQVIVTGGREGIVEIIEPSTLETLARIHFDFGGAGVGINGVSVSADGARLYVDGPTPSDPHGCCFLYSVHLPSVQTTIAASIPGSSSRDQFVFADGLVFPAAGRSVKGMSHSLLHLSPDGRWLFGVRSYPAPALEIFHRTRGELLHELTPPQLDGDSWRNISGAWAGERFYLYAETSDGQARLWDVSPEATELGPGLGVESSSQTPGCSVSAYRELVAAGDRLFLYEPFGFILDRRSRCDVPISGGAWTVDPASGRLLSHIAPEAHFAALVADRTSGLLYGVAYELRNGDGAGQLLSIDGRDGRILKSRPVGPGFLRMVVAPLRVVPAGDVRAIR